MLEREDAKCIKGNLNAMERAIVEGDRIRALSALGTLRANLYAHYYDVLPIGADGQRSWPKVKPGDTWECGGEQYPFSENEYDRET